MAMAWLWETRVCGVADCARYATGSSGLSTSRPAARVPSVSGTMSVKPWLARGARDVLHVDQEQDEVRSVRVCDDASVCVALRLTWLCVE